MLYRQNIMNGYKAFIKLSVFLYFFIK